MKLALVTTGITALLAIGLTSIGVILNASVEELIIANCVMTPTNWVLTYNTLK